MQTLIKDIRLSPHCQIGLGITAKAVVQLLPGKSFRVCAERDERQDNLRPTTDLLAGNAPDMGNPAHNIPRLRAERSALKPFQKLWYMGVGYIFWVNAVQGAPVGKSGHPCL